MKNPKYTPADQEAYKARFRELTETLPHTFTGFEYHFENKWADLTPAQRRKVLEDVYEDGSLKLWLGHLRPKRRLGSPLGESKMQHTAEIGSPPAVAGQSAVHSLCESPPRLEGEGDPCRQPRLHRLNFRLTMTAN